MRKIDTLSIMLTLIIFYSNSAFAWRCGQSCPSSWLSGRAECLANNKACTATTDIINTTSDGRFNVYVNNKCRDYIDVNVKYKYTNSTVWNTKKYSFSPGEKAYLVDTDNRYIYISAKSSPVSNKNYSWKRKQLDMGSRFSKYTYSLTCR